jgi:hypothetical protein
MAFADKLLKVPDDSTDALAEEAIDYLGVKLILPLLDVLEFDNRNVFKELFVNEMRSILQRDGEAPKDRDELKKSMMVE